MSDKNSGVYFEVKLSPEQLRVASLACEMMSRMRLGQFDVMLRGCFGDLLHEKPELRAEAEQLLTKLTRLMQSHSNAPGSLTARHDSNGELGLDVAMDLHQSFRRAYALHRGAQPDDWNTHVYEPIPYSDEGCPKVTRMHSLGLNP